MNTDRMVNEHGFLEVRFDKRIFGRTDEFEPGNPFIRKRRAEVVTTRHCKECGRPFTLHVPYDPTDYTHDLCENCLLPDDEEEKDKPRAIKGDEFTSLQVECARMETNGKEFVKDGDVIIDD